MNIDLKYICYILIITAGIFGLTASYATKKESQQASPSLRLANAFISEELEKGMNSIILEGYEVDVIEHCGHESINAIVPIGMAYAFDKRYNAQEIASILEVIESEDMKALFEAFQKAENEASRTGQPVAEIDEQVHQKAMDTLSAFIMSPLGTLFFDYFETSEFTNFIKEGVRGHITSLACFKSVTKSIETKLN